MNLKIQNTLSVKLFQLLQSLNIVSFSTPLFEPEAFHTYMKLQIITQQCGCLFYKQKNPVRRLFEPEAFHLDAIIIPVDCITKLPVESYSI
jgi:hypothetical protein